MKLDDHKMRYIIRAMERGESCGNIALQLSVSKRRAEQICTLYKSSGQLPSLWRGGRRSVPITEEERRVVLDAYGRYMVNAVYLKGMIEADYGVHINHDRIHWVLKAGGFVTPSRKRWIRRKWARYERDYSNSLWHVD